MDKLKKIFRRNSEGNLGLLLLIFLLTLEVNDEDKKKKETSGNIGMSSSIVEVNTLEELRAMLSSYTTDIAYFCDVCRAEIPHVRNLFNSSNWKLRYHCWLDECLDFDLCETCHKKTSHPHRLWSEKGMINTITIKLRFQVNTESFAAGPSVAETLVKLFARYSQRPCLGKRNISNPIRYDWFSYEQIEKRCRNFGSGNLYIIFEIHFFQDCFIKLKKNLVL